VLRLFELREVAPGKLLSYALSRSNGVLNGTAPCRGALRLFELREVAPGEPLSDGTQRLAVAVSDSSERPSPLPSPFRLRNARYESARAPALMPALMLHWHHGHDCMGTGPRSCFAGL